MRLLSYEHQGQESYGALVGNDGVVDLRRALGGRHADLQALIAADAFGETAAALAGRAPDLALGALTVLPVIPRPGKIWCCGLNYHEHVRETQREVTAKPMYFQRVADSQVGHGQAIALPAESTQLDFEGELAVIIGKPGRRIPEARAFEHIAGYACYNDGSIRDWQRHTQQFGPGKNFWRTGGFGPWMVTADEIPPGTVMTLVTRLNGQEMQRATTDMMIHGIAQQLAYLSTIAPLRAGDVVVTGTPGGVGARREPPVWMKPGDVVEIHIDRVGVLRNPVCAEGDLPASV